jgi:NAD(P)-dependent dehydrogenase (short-subunit alcohol dehydrogenase family)
MPTALIIGASRGIGREFVRQLLVDNWKVFATARSDDAIASLRQAGAEPIRIDVAVSDSLAELSWQLDGEKLDLAVYVAGIYGTLDGANEPPAAQDFDNVMHTNVLGAMQAIPLIAPMVEAANGKLICITSGMGSIGEVSSSTAWVYRASKAALNMVVKSASFDYPKATLAVMSPGWVRTDMGGPNATISVEQSVGDMLSVIDSLTLADTGTFRGHSGRHIAW